MAAYSLAETARILRVSPARLRYWERTALVRRAGDDAEGSGFDFQDLVILRAVVGLLDSGVSLRRIRATVERLRERLPECDEPLRSLRVHDGSGRVVMLHEDSLEEPDGQLVIDFAEPDEAVAKDATVATLAPRDDDGESAIVWFERASQLDADPATAGEAEAAYRRAVELEPDFADAWCNLGTLEYNRGRRAEARAHYEHALGIDAEHLEARFNLGNLLEEEGRRESALVHYKAAARIDPFFPEAQLNLALLYEKLGLEATAREHWRRYLQVAPDGPWADVARDRLG